MKRLMTTVNLKNKGNKLLKEESRGIVLNSKLKLDSLSKSLANLLQSSKRKKDPMHVKQPRSHGRLTKVAKLNLDKLNPPQREAVLHGLGPMLILAGAGSGKTSTMTYRIAHLISEKNVKGAQILALSFTRKAAEELRERVKGMVTKVSGAQACKGLTLTTFHSLCARLLRENAAKIGYSPDFTIFDQNDQGDLVKQILKNIHVDDRKFDPDFILFEMGQAKNRSLAGEAAKDFFFNGGRLQSDYADVTATVYEHYQNSLKSLNAMDFDDLIFRTAQLFRENIDVRKHYSQRFQNILVDEYQDTNPAQFELLNFLTCEHQNICVVGDDDQSIYSWRGADSKHILEFHHHYPSARLITLEQNYRSTNTILDAANAVITQNKQRHPKTLWSDRGTGELIDHVILEEDRGESDFVAEEILRLARTVEDGNVTQRRPWKDFAILYRSNPQSRVFEESLRMRQIPYKIVGTLSFLDRKEVKDVLSYWRLILNMQDDASARRVINWPVRGISRAALEAINEYCLKNQKQIVEVLPLVNSIYPRAFEGAHSFHVLLQELKQALTETPATPVSLAEWARRSLDRIGVRKALLEECEDPVLAERKWENVEELCNALGQINLEEVKSLSNSESALDLLRDYLTHLLLEARDEESDKDKDENKSDRDQVTLLTLHGSKGLEYPVVFLVGMEEGLLPHRRSIEEARDFSEERRLCYVGITRARDRLYITRCAQRTRYGKQVLRTPSRFLQEIPPHLIRTQNESSAPDNNSEEALDKHEAKVKDFLASIRAQLKK